MVIGTVLASLPTGILAQSITASNRSVREEKETFIRNLKSSTNDPTIIQPLSRYFDSEISTIHTSVKSYNRVPPSEKEKAVRSLVYFLQELNNALLQKKLDIYDIPGTVRSYSNVLNALLYHKPVIPLMRNLGHRRAQIIASAFTQFNEYSLLDDIVVFKRMASSPEFILHFLESKPGFRFADSLLQVLAAHDPVKLVYYLERKKGFQDRIRQSKNIYVEQIADLSTDKMATELVPFVTQIAEKKMEPVEISEKRKVPLSYFQLMVNTLQESIESGDGNFIFINPLRNGIRQKALAFYINGINDLHNAPESARFASVKGLRPQDLYYIITTGGDELYTSSYLGLYKRLMEHYKNQPADSLFELVRYDDLRVFLRMAANYNVLGDFMLRLSPGRRKEVLRRFISGIERDESTALEKAMDIADSFTSLGSAPEISDLFKSELASNLNHSIATQDFLGMRLYGILSDIFNLIRESNGMQKLWDKLGDYEVLRRKTLENANGEVVQLVLFYGDDDGKSSYNNFLKFYAGDKNWKVTHNGYWVSIRSVSGKPVSIYANKPMDSRDDQDLAAQQKLLSHLNQESLEPTVLVHRGHSYHLDKTLAKLTPAVRLAILGSCGGYNKAISLAAISPDVQVIGSKKTGAKSINDPVLDEINDALVNNNDLLWPEIWKNLAKRFGKDPVTLSLFNEYFPPGENLGLFVIKLYNYYSRVR